MNAPTIAAMTALLAGPPIVSTTIVDSTPIDMTSTFSIFLALVTGLVIGAALGLQIARTYRAKDRADAERLDFLDAAGYSVVCSQQTRLWGVLDIRSSDGVRVFKPTVREAIDVAAGASEVANG